MPDQDPISPSDEELVYRCRAGDQEAFAILMSRHEKDCFKIACYKTGDREEAKDIVQLAFIEVFDRLDSLVTAQLFGLFVKRITRNKSIDFTRRRARIRNRIRKWREFFSTEESISHPDHFAKLIRVLGEALPKLSEDDRYLIKLYYFDGLTYREVGYEIGCSAHAAEYRVGQARVRLQEIMDDLLGDE